MQPPDPQSLALLAQADLILLVAELFRPHGTAPAEPPPLPEEIDALLRAASLDEQPQVAQAMHELFAAAATANYDRRDEYHRLFEGPMPCPLTETAFIRRDKGAVIGDLCGFYRAFGWTADPRTGEKPDHLATELQFVAVLLAMLAAARGNNDEARSQIALKALRSFSEAHLGDWLPSVCTRLRETAVLPLFHAAADAADSLWRALAGRHGLFTSDSPTPPRMDELPPTPEEPCGGPAAETVTRLTVQGR